MKDRASTIALLVCGFAAGGCSNDPQYLDAPNQIAVMDDGMGGFTDGKASLVLPIKHETSTDKAARDKLAAKLGVMVPYVRVGDLDVEVEYTIQNLDSTDGIAIVELNGANEWFVYDPSVIMLNPGDDEAPPTPGLQGDIPVTVPAMGTVEGVFREDQLLEASIDLDEITRGNINPFAATLTIDKDDKTFQPLTAYVPPPADDPEGMPPPQDPMGPIVPREAFAQMVRIDLVLKPDEDPMAGHHMTMTYAVRVRDHRGIMDDMGMASPASQIVAFMPTVFMPQ